MKFSVRWLEEKTTQIDVADIGEAVMYSVAMINRLGGFPATKLLSIYEVKTTPQQGDGKPPTPFGRPPSGTLGGGQMKIAEALPDAIAVAA